MVQERFINLKDNDCILIPNISDRLQLFKFTGDLTTRVDTGSAYLGQLFISLSILGCQQNLVQRYLSMKTEKEVKRLVYTKAKNNEYMLWKLHIYTKTQKKNYQIDKDKLQNTVCQRTLHCCFIHITVDSGYGHLLNIHQV